MSPSLSVHELSWTLTYPIREEMGGVGTEEESLEWSVTQLAHLFIDTEDEYSIYSFFIIILYSSKFRKNSVGKYCMLGCSGHGFGWKCYYFCKQRCPFLLMGMSLGILLPFNMLLCDFIIINEQPYNTLFQNSNKIVLIT